MTCNTIKLAHFRSCISKKSAIFAKVNDDFLLNQWGLTYPSWTK
ncbi:hypothetical protein THERMOS_1266 [Bathymodiolus thermophilus thioautotrophic gill symbiont]|uniref:Uncharacterized protein n=1 Tax=Bathymodiolus thermophilus thioautotrophic gill symbiont TaxID=2360 RepID=A0A8H8XF56_9GAMM|nr:hypothetical protein THERMOS_1266 [Bathymodiolus thermophilus thioautotrophic gill symbiont]